MRYDAILSMWLKKRFPEDVPFQIKGDGEVVRGVGYHAGILSRGKLPPLPGLTIHVTTPHSIGISLASGETKMALPRGHFCHAVMQFTPPHHEIIRRTSVSILSRRTPTKRARIPHKETLLFSDFREP
jgi:hypothetical protein